MSSKKKAPATLVKKNTITFTVETVQQIDGVDQEIEFQCVGDHISRAVLDDLTAKQQDGKINNADIIGLHIKQFSGFKDENGADASSDTIKAYILDDAGLCLATVTAYTRRLLGLTEGNSPRSRRG